MPRNTVTRLIKPVVFGTLGLLPLAALALTTREDTPKVISVTDIPLANSCTSIKPVAVPGTGLGQIVDNGNVVYVAVTGPTIPCANIVSGLVKWEPGLHQVSPTSFSYTVDGAATVYTLNLDISPLVNDPPVLGNNVVKNGELLGDFSPPTFTNWDAQIVNHPPSPTSGGMWRPDIGHSYGGAGFNTGDTPPAGILQQVMNTVPGTLYTVNFQITYGGNLSADQQLTISVADGPSNNAAPFGPLPGTALYSQVYGQQAGTQSFTFTAQSTQSTLRIADTTKNGTTISTDIALVYIHAYGGPPAQSLLEDSSLVFSSANLNGFAASDPDGEVTNYTLTATVGHGILKLASTNGLTITGGNDGGSTVTIQGSLTSINQALEGLRYTPTAHFNGSDNLAVSLSDNGGNGSSGICPTYPNPYGPNPQFCNLSAALSVPLTVVPVNDPPVSQDKLGITVAEDTPYTFSAADFAFNDPIDAANASGANAFTGVQISSLPTTGNLTFNGAPVTVGQLIPATSLAQLIWTPAANSHGNNIAQFSFQVQDDGGTANGGVDLSQPHIVSFNVTAVIDQPIANHDSYSTLKDTALPLTAAQLLGNDTDPDGGTLAITSVQAPVNGTVSMNGTNIVFTPAAGYVGAASFTYTISNGNGGTATATVNILVTTTTPPVADATPVPASGTAALALMTLLLTCLAGLALQKRRVRSS